MFDPKKVLIENIETPMLAIAKPPKKSTEEDALDILINQLENNDPEIVLTTLKELIGNYNDKVIVSLVVFIGRNKTHKYIQEAKQLYNYNLTLKINGPLLKAS